MDLERKKREELETEILNLRGEDWILRTKFTMRKKDFLVTHATSGKLFLLGLVLQVMNHDNVD